MLDVFAIFRNYQLPFLIFPLVPSILFFIFDSYNILGGSPAATPCLENPKTLFNFNSIRFPRRASVGVDLLGNFFLPYFRRPPSNPFLYSLFSSQIVTTEFLCPFVSIIKTLLPEIIYHQQTGSYKSALARRELTGMSNNKKKEERDR